MNLDWTPVKNKKLNPEAIHTCPYCHKEITFHINFINANLAKCTWVHCKKYTVENVIKTLLHFRQFKYLNITKCSTGQRVVHFICNNNHKCEIRYERLRRGSGCKICTRKRVAISRTINSNILIKTKNLLTCKCKELNLGKYHSASYICLHYNHSVLYPESATEWDFERNNTRPDKVAPKSNTKFNFICSNESCNKKYSQRLSDRAAGNRCPYCSNHKLSYSKSFEYKFPDLCQEWDPANNFKPSQVFAHSDIIMSWICRKESCRYKWRAKCNSRSNGHGCAKCNNPGLSAKMGGDSQFLKLSMKIHNNKYSYPKSYVHSKQKVTIICPKHGKFQQYPRDHKRGHGCSRCGMEQIKSKPILNICSELTKLGISFETELTLPGLKYIRELYLDISVLTHNLVIEYDGEHHFESINAWGGQDHLDKTQIRDILKDKYLTTHGISLIRIPYVFKKYQILIEPMLIQAKSGLVYASYGNYIHEVREKVDLSKYTVIDLSEYIKSK